MNLFSKKSIKIPPPIVTSVFGLIMYGLSLVYPWQATFAFKTTLLTIFLLIAVLLLLPAVFQFYLHKTTVNPLHPEKANKLVVSGLYRFSRNPMYLGMAMLLFSWGIYLGNPLNTLLFIGFIGYMNRFQIKVEELALETLFGEDFLNYKARVRRWI